VTPLDSKCLKRFLQLAGDSLRGEWLLVGGTLLPAVGVDIRSTVDIDLVGLSSKEAAQSLELMELAEKLDLGVETINQAASYFVNKCGYKRTDLIPMIKGKSATIFRPSVQLYWRLKIARLSETDAIDCQYYYHYCISQNDPIDHKQLRSAVASAIKSEASSGKLNRLQRLSTLSDGR